jgi:nucleoside 2-deoxyribosyltransferase
MKVYIAAPMFSNAEKEFNVHIADQLAGLGYDTYLPQRDGGEAAALVRQGMDEDSVRRRIYETDRAAISECAALVFVLDGRVPDEGACVELGMAVALGKPCVGLQTDCRRFGGTDSNNLMIDYSLAWIAHSVPEFTARLPEWLAKITTTEITASTELTAAH